MLIIKNSSALTPVSCPPTSSPGCSLKVYIIIFCINQLWDSVYWCLSYLGGWTFSSFCLTHSPSFAWLPNHLLLCHDWLTHYAVFALFKPWQYCAPMSPVEYYDYISFIIQLFFPCDKNSYFFLTGLVSIPIVNFPVFSVHFCTFKPINQTKVIYQFFLFFSWSPRSGSTLSSALSGLVVQGAWRPADFLPSS